MTVVLSSAAVTDWPERLLLTAAVVLVMVALVALLRVGWVRRGRRQQDIGGLPPVPALPDALRVAHLRARYLGTTRSGDWLDRVVVHGLGVPSAAEVSVGDDGVWCLRQGAPSLFVARDDLVAASHERGIAGKVFEREGALVVTWRLGESMLDTGLRVRDASEAERLRQALVDLIVPSAAVPAPSSGESE